MGGVCGAGVASTRCCSSASGSFCASAVSAAETAWRSRTRHAFSAAVQRCFRSSAGIAVREVPCVESSRTCERIRCGESSSRRSANPALPTLVAPALVARESSEGRRKIRGDSQTRSPLPALELVGRLGRLGRGGGAKWLHCTAVVARALEAERVREHTHTTSPDVPRRSRCALVRLGVTSELRNGAAVFCIFWLLNSHFNAKPVCFPF